MFMAMFVLLFGQPIEMAKSSCNIRIVNIQQIEQRHGKQQTNPIVSVCKYRFVCKLIEQDTQESTHIHTCIDRIENEMTRLKRVVRLTFWGMQFMFVCSRFVIH